MSSWSCPHQVDDRCRKVAGAYCRPGMRGCVLVGRVSFQDGVVPHPVWPDGAPSPAPLRGAKEVRGQAPSPAPLRGAKEVRGQADPRERAEVEEALAAADGER